MKRREIRQLALQGLYQVDIGKTEVEEAVLHVLEDVQNVTDADGAYLRRLVQGAVSALDEVDALLSKSLEGWRIDRVAKVELNVLRLAVYELLYEKDVDVATVVNEAVELAKAFSTEESGRFVNGVLAKVLPAVKDRR